MAKEIKNLPTLKINKLSQAQYAAANQAGLINEDELYLTPYEEVDLTNYYTKDEVKAEIAKAQLEGEEVDLSGFALAGHHHDGTYAKLGHSHVGTYAPVEHDHDDKYAEKIDAPITVNLGDGIALGGYNQGDTIEVGTSIKDILTKLLQKVIIPTCVYPTLEAKPNVIYAYFDYSDDLSSTDPFEKNVVFTAAYKKGDAGSLTKFEIANIADATDKVSLDITDANKDDDYITLTYEKDITFTSNTTITYKSYASYEAGAPLEDNFGGKHNNDITAGHKDDYTGVTLETYWPKCFYGLLSDGTTINQATLLGLSKCKNAGTFDVETPQTESAAKQVTGILVASTSENGLSSATYEFGGTEYPLTDEFSPQATPITLTKTFKDDDGTKIVEQTYYIWLYTASFSTGQKFKITMS